MLVTVDFRVKKIVIQLYFDHRVETVFSNRLTGRIEKLSLTLTGGLCEDHTFIIGHSRSKIVKKVIKWQIKLNGPQKVLKSVRLNI